MSLTSYRLQAFLQALTLSFQYVNVCELIHGKHYSSLQLTNILYLDISAQFCAYFILSISALHFISVYLDC